MPDTTHMCWLARRLSTSLLMRRASAASNEVRWDEISYTLTCAQQLTAGQLNLPHGTRNWTNEEKNQKQLKQRCFTKHTPHASRHQRALRHLVTPSPPADGMVSSAARQRHLQRTAYATPYDTLSLERKTLFGDLYLWPWHSNSSQRGTKHVFPVNLAQIRSTITDIFVEQTKKSQTALKQNLICVQ